jgi:hypothetical protein
LSHPKFEFFENETRMARKLTRGTTTCVAYTNVWQNVLLGSSNP